MLYRKTYRGNKLSVETAFYVSSLPPTTKASVFAKGIRGHWSIENSLHYTKDVTFNEDKSKITKGNSPQNMSIIRNITINILRENNYKNLKQATRLLADNIKKLVQFIK